MRTKDEDFVDQVYVVNTHTPVLFFSSAGMVYKLKVYKLPQGSPTARGKAMVNLLPLQEGETITTMMPMPEDEESWADWFVMFATASGNVRRNSLKDFVRVQSNGKIAMKLDEGDRLVSVQTCNEEQDVLLATRMGRCIRFPVGKVRVFAGRNSTGVRGIKLADGDEVISMTLLRHAEFDSVEERDAYLKLARQRRAEDETEAEEAGEAPPLPEERYEEMAANEQFLLSVTAKGFGKRSSAYEYRVTGRGGQGVTNMDLGKAKPDENWVAAVFPVADGDQIMLVTNSGQTIRCPVADIRIAGRATRGVTIFRIGEEEHVVSVAHLAEEDEDGDEDPDGEAEAAEKMSAPVDTPESDDAD
jgi:DNA gyrase subunit A